MFSTVYSPWVVIGILFAISYKRNSYSDQWRTHIKSSIALVTVITLTYITYKHFYCKRVSSSCRHHACSAFRNSVLEFAASCVWLFLLDFIINSFFLQKHTCSCTAFLRPPNWYLQWKHVESMSEIQFTKNLHWEIVWRSCGSPAKVICRTICVQEALHKRIKQKTIQFWMNIAVYLPWNQYHIVQWHQCWPRLYV